MGIASMIGIMVRLLAAGGVFLAARGFIRHRRALGRARSQLTVAAPTITENGTTYRDLNNNGRMDVYEDPTRPITERVEDLLSQMTLEEKAGQMMQPMISANQNGNLIEMPSATMSLGTSEMIVNRNISHYNIVRGGSIEAMATWYNNLQTLAEKTRLGIPVTISTDPRHSASDVPGTSISTDGFSQWPDPLGLAATRDATLVEQFGNIARQEYIGVGIRAALHPMADLCTEPRWSRLSGTFGEDAELASEMTGAYIRGFQNGGDGVGRDSVTCMVKHFPGGGPQEDGWDPHFSYGKNQVYPGNNFEYHLPPFQAAFDAGVEQVMPYYGVPVGQTSEDVGMAFNKEIITDMLRERFDFQGVVCTDWMVAESVKALGMVELLEATAWGVEHLSVRDRFKKALVAGVDQFGGHTNPQYIIDLVRDGELPESRIDASVRRILTVKFKLGLFDNPYVDMNALTSTIGTQANLAAGEEAQRKSVVLLKNEGDLLPLTGRPKFYVENIRPEVVKQYGELVKKPEDADFAILRLATPYQKPPGKNLLERFFHQGDLDFKSPEKEHILKIANTVPTIVDMYLERATVFPDIAAASKGIFATFGINDDILFEALFGRFNPTGKLPLELPSSMEAVRNQKEDVPYDSENPLFPFDFGLSYKE